MTNYERIKSMSVEDLAYFLDYSVYEDEYFHTMIDKKVFFGMADLVEWLESEVDENA